MGKRIPCILVFLMLPTLAAADPWQGAWSDGNLTLTLRQDRSGYAGEAELDGTRYPLAGRKVGEVLLGTYQHEGQTFPWRASRHAEALVFEVDGQTLVLHKMKGAGTARGKSPASSTKHLSAEGQRWRQGLAGRRLTQLDSYYSGPATQGGVGGGYSSEKAMDVCSDGRFYYSASGSVGLSGDGISATRAGRGAEQGHWRIIEQGGLVGVEFQWQDGSVSQHRLGHENGTVYIDGTRTFVTADNRSCP